MVFVKAFSVDLMLIFNILVFILANFGSCGYPYPLFPILDKFKEFNFKVPESIFSDDLLRIYKYYCVKIPTWLNLHNLSETNFCHFSILSL